MAEVVLFHHAQGLTPGVLAFAGELRRAGGDLTVEGRERRVSNPQKAPASGRLGTCVPSTDARSRRASRA
jgi:hypothetical protein